MSRLCPAAAIVVSVILAGCAAADPSGGNQGEVMASASPAHSQCPVGQMLTCEVQSPSRISDGRYGFRSNKKKVCSCQPDADVRVLENRDLPLDRR